MTHHWFILRVQDEANFRAAWGVVSPDEKLGQLIPGAGGKTLMTGSSRISRESAKKLTKVAQVYFAFPSDWVPMPPEEDSEPEKAALRTRMTNWFNNTFKSRTANGRL